MTHSHMKTVAVANEMVFLGAIVVPEHLLIQVAEEMERFHANVGSFESALEQAPEVFESVGVNLPVNIRLGMVNDLVRESGLQVLVGHERVGINCTASRDVFF